MIRRLFIMGCLVLMTPAFGALSPDGGCPPRIVVQEKTMDDGQIITTLEVSGSIFETDEQQPFRFDGSRSELFAELDKRAKHKRFMQIIAIGSAGALLAGSIVVFGHNNAIAKNGKKLVEGSAEYKKYVKRDKIMTGMFVSSIVAGVSAPFIGDHGWRKYRDKLEELFDKGELTARDRGIIKVLEHYLDATSDFELRPFECL